MLGFLITIHTIVSLFLVTSILMQASQGGGLAGSFGGQASNAILGSRGTASMLSKITTWLVVMFMALAILISLVGSSLRLAPKIRFKLSSASAQVSTRAISAWISGVKSRGQE